MSMGASDNNSVSQNSYNLNLPKISHVARSNSLRCSSPPRTNYREPNIPIALQEEINHLPMQPPQPQPYPLVHQVDNIVRKIPPNNNNNHAPISAPNAVMGGKPNEMNRMNGAFGSQQAQSHHFQQHQHHQQLTQQQQTISAGMRQDHLNNNPQRSSVTSSVNSTGVQSNVGLNGNKQEQRLTHEQFRAALQMVSKIKMIKRSEKQFFFLQISGGFSRRSAKESRKFYQNWRRQYGNCLDCARKKYE